MSLFLFLTVVQTIVAAALVGVVLVQRSEGGGLGMGGGPGSVMGARGTADFLTRSTRWLAIAFVVLSITLAAVAVETAGSDEISSTLDRTIAPADPLGAAAGTATGPVAPETTAPVNDDPLAGQTE